MFWKDQLANDILHQNVITAEWLIELGDKYPPIRVKTLDANGRIPVIQFNGKGEWLKPREWAFIHVANLKQRHVELHHRLMAVGSDPIPCDQIDGNLEPAGPWCQSDPSDTKELVAKLNLLYESYVRVVDLLWQVNQGKRLDEYTSERVDEMVFDEAFYLL